MYLWHLRADRRNDEERQIGAGYTYSRPGAFATLMGPFLITFSNHTPATFSVMFAWLSLLQIAQQRDGPPAWHHFVRVGFFAAFAAANELPALSFTAAVFALSTWWQPRRTLLLALPPALLVGGGVFRDELCGVADTWRPAYSEFGGPWHEYEGSHWRLALDQHKSGIDWARKNGETPAEYAVHVLIGHHGPGSIDADLGCWQRRAMVRSVFRLRA